MQHISAYKVKQTLSNANVTFFTYTPKQRKNQTFLLKGLHQSEDVDEILAELKKCDSSELDIIKVSRFTTKRSSANNYLLPIFLVQISPNSQSKYLHQIKSINHQLIRWEKLKKKGGILQCKNCQRFGHAAVNCNMGYRCVKCDKTHQPGECSIVSGNVEKANIFCISCNSFGHPASYKGCPSHKKLIVQMRERLQTQNEQRQLKQKMVSNYSRPEVTYANLLKKTNTVSKEQSNVTSMQNNEISIMFSQFQQNILSTIENQFKVFEKMLTEQKHRIDALYEAIDFESVNYG